jgi:hypothetical protein
MTHDLPLGVQILAFWNEHFLAILGILIPASLTLWVYVREKQKKCLSYDLKSKTKLITIHDERIGNLQISFDGEPVKNAHIFIVVVFNSGNIPIVSDDYEKYLEIMFSEQTEILSADVIEKNPGDLDVAFEVARNLIRLKPTLLNSGDSVTFKFLTRDDSFDPIVSGRIVGVGRITKSAFISDQEHRILTQFFIFGMALVVVAIGVAFLLEHIGLLLPGVSLMLLVAWMLGAFAGMVMLALLKPWSSKR